MLEITYHGHSAFTMSDGEYTIVFDPWLNGNPTAISTPADMPALDAVLVSHGHPDHLGDAVELSKINKAPVIAPFELALFCQRRGATVHPMNHGGRFSFDFGSVKLTRAIHSSSFVDKGAEYTGNPCGFVVKMGGLTVYYAGDTALFGDMKLLAELDPFDIAILPIGDNFTMGPEEAAMAVKIIDPKYVIPMHYATFEVLEQTPERFVCLTATLPAETVVLEVGETRRFD
jgi:L-ascorbate metabolism protein UlaG (beta-lactamase superfamily)